MVIEKLFPALSTTDEQKTTKSKVLIYIIGVSILACSSVWGNSLFGSLDSDFSFAGFIFGLLMVLGIFRWTNSLLLATNAFLMVVSFFLMKASLGSGGIYSDDMFLLCTIPLIAYLLSEALSAVFWLIAVNTWGYYLYTLVDTPAQIEFFRNQTLKLNPEYYFVFCILISCVLFALLSVFYFENKKLIKKLHEHRLALEEKNKEYAIQTSELESTQERLKLSNKELEQYAYVTSHDLKQPIRTVHSFVNLLEYNLMQREALDEESKQFMDLIKERTENMLKLVGDLLSYAKLSATKEVPLERMPLDKVLNNVLGSLKNQIDSNQVTIERDGLPTLDVIPTKIDQVFQNIISNAIKFKKKDQPLTIKILSEQKADHWEVAIEDNGIGIAKEHQQKIFAPFKKLHNEQEYSGSGIGLATCKRIVNLHKGKIWVESEKDKGTRFIFTLPRSQSN